VEAALLLLETYLDEKDQKKLLSLKQALKKEEEVMEKNYDQ
jgi:hypothetical protein